MLMEFARKDEMFMGYVSFRESTAAHKKFITGELSVEQISYNKYWAISRPCKAKDKLLLRVLKSMKTR